MTAGKTVQRRYTPEDKRAGLITLLATGSATVASEQTGIPKSTLESWRENDVELWSKLSHEHGAQVDQAIAAQMRETVVTLGNIERKLTNRLWENADKLDVRDIPNALKNVTASKAQNTDKLLLLTGRATDRVEHVDARDLITEIRKIAEPYVNSTAEDA